MQGEIDAREDSFRATAEAGQLLVDNEHFAAPEVAEKLITLSTEKQNLLTIWEERRILYEQGGEGMKLKIKKMIAGTAIAVGAGAMATGVAILASPVILPAVGFSASGMN